MIGDRYLTDIVYGNRHGMLTIRPSPLTSEGEHQSVRLVSKDSMHVRHSWTSSCKAEVSPVPLSLRSFNLQLT